MFKRILLGFAAFGFTLASTTASAGSDEQYPASNFQPKVVFIDEELADQLDSAQAAQQAGKKSSGEAASIAGFDPKYPAAYFQPKVIYP
ncbi:hypothetical protein [Methylotuvimicrobium alcaliphilum]|uniref:Uncharacterized protein n=1 Tax=Methylotuvimicrobium alcaliphilum (strain DSM 19304 / NCIMB 14124 / VKM B-2133 / 20Z) TaxID=1091494 RepID=G4SZ84_META2|nr:hypothetical protein [Methylotuvimicrobium alcaliphilum]CCE22234.1 conserved exported protein of unknown function [Methylotuvimicrobium alcaliphilum 20Z]